MTMTNMIQKKAEEQKAVAVTKQPKSLKDWVQAMMPQIAKALPSVITPERFTRIVTTALSTNPKLAECTRDSFLGSMMTAAQLGLEPNTPLGQAYLIPRKNGKTGVTECTFQPGYKGLIDLAYRSGEVSTVGAQVVYANDEFSYQLGLDPDLKHKPAMTDRGEPIAFYGFYKLKDGGFGFEVMSVDAVRAHAQKFSEAVKRGYSSPWQTNFEEMAKKTVLKKALKYAPMKTDFVRAVAADESVVNYTDEDSEPIIIPVDGDVIDPDTGEVVSREEGMNGENTEQT